MLRLADHRDTGYLSMLQGHEVAARYRRVQRRLLREYLHGLSRDFHRLHTIATQGALRSRQESEISFFALAQKKIEFAFSLWIVEVRLLVDGISPCRVDLGPLLASLDQLMAKVR
jgi:hypothetical protein